MASKKHGKPPVLLAHKWATKHNPAGWWMSEKLDGVRAYWDGKRFLSRQGNEYLAPGWFTRPLPKHPLDGELWIDRKQFQKVVGVVRRHKADDDWKRVRYLVFDAPSHGGVFEDRVDHLTDLIKGMSVKHVVPVDHVRCRDHAHLITEFNRVESLGGEGLMLREPRSLYIAGRSRSLLKVKRFHDAEAKVLGYIDGQGRHAGRVGALSVVTPGGVRFAIGSGLKDADRDDPPKIGSIVTYRYQELTDAGIPRFPTFVRIRDDFDWPTSGGGTSRPVASSVPLTPSAAKKKTSSKTTAKKSAKKTSKTSKTASKATPAPASASTSQTRYFEKAGTPGKFWEVTAQGIAMAVRYGSLGTRGKTKIKTFRDAARATAEAE